MRAALGMGLALTLLISSSSAHAQAAAPRSNPPPTTRPAEPPLHFTSLRRFGLPINIGPASRSIAAVQLHVSTDGGRTWRTYDQRPPTAKEFVFQTGSDGEYCFASKTVDQRNVVRPTGPTRVEQRVIVDTEIPQLEFHAEALPAGQLACKWRIADPHLDLASLKLEYQIEATGPWLTVTVPAMAMVTQPGVMTGQHQWHVESPTRAMHVRIEAKDRAGNRVADVRRVFAPRVAGVAPQGTPSQDSLPMARSQVPATIPWPLDEQDSAGNPAATLADRSPESSWQPINRAANGARLATQQPAPVAKPGDLPAEAPEAGALAATPGLSSDRSARAAADAVDASRPAGPGRLAAMSPAGNVPLPDAGGPVTGTYRPSVGNQVAPDDTADAGQTSAGAITTSDNAAPSSSGSDADALWPELPVGQVASMTRSTHFYLDYDVESAGPDGVADVELWGTRDGGRTWARQMSDPDKQSPFDVVVPGEGLYGFRIVLVAANGLASDAPRSGSPADLWVGVDMSPPTVEVTAVVYGTGARFGELDIRWSAEDRRLSDRPISLSFGTQRDGPWTTIATGLPNSGQYFWKVDHTVPQYVFLRIECQDEAGNRAETITREPINTEGLAPKGQIRSVRAAE